MNDCLVIDPANSFKCLTCFEGFGLNQDRTKCVNCNPLGETGCAHCSINDSDEPMKCLGCINNLRLSNTGSCYWPECDAYSVMRGGFLMPNAVCNECENGYGKDGITCKRCDRTGEYWNSCDDCNVYLGTLNDCTGCQNGKTLIDCEATSNLDPRCADSAHSNGPRHQCLYPLIPNCDVISTEQDQYCIQCSDGYFWDESTKQCTECSIPKCSEC